jgi:hypothetical protein
MKWAIVLLLYVSPYAPPMDWEWPGPFVTAPTPMASSELFQSEGECRNFAIGWIGRIHPGMLTPVRFRCVSFPEYLPKGAPRG